MSEEPVSSRPRFRTVMNEASIPIDADDLNSVLTHIHVGDLHIDLAELLGPAPADEGKPRLRVLGAIVPHNGATWFFKLTGPDALVAREKNAFIAFIQSIQPAR